MHKSAHAFLQEMICQVLANVQSLANVCDAGLFTDFPKVDVCDSTGLELPESLQDLFPGAGGSAAKAGVKIPAVGDDKRSVFGHFARTAWNIPANQDVAMVVTCAQKGGLCLGD